MLHGRPVSIARVYRPPGGIIARLPIGGCTARGGAMVAWRAYS
eukprot:COSAG01_NODE_42385_length_440_cov_2.260997_1_plen_42_part_01